MPPIEVIDHKTTPHNDQNSEPVTSIHPFAVIALVVMFAAGLGLWLGTLIREWMQ